MLSASEAGTMRSGYSCVRLAQQAVQLQNPSTDIKRPKERATPRGSIKLFLFLSLSVQLHLPLINLVIAVAVKHSMLSGKTADYLLHLDIHVVQQGETPRSCTRILQKLSTSQPDHDEPPCQRNDQDRRTSIKLEEAE